MNEDLRAELHEYIRPIAPDLWRFAYRAMGASEFEDRFWEQWPNLNGELHEQAFVESEYYFQCVEDWNSDDRLRSTEALSTEELRTRTATFLECAGYNSPPEDASALDTTD